MGFKQGPAELNRCRNQSLSRGWPEDKQIRWVESVDAGEIVSKTIMQTATKPATLELTGKSGNRYALQVYDWGTTFKPLPGVYAVTNATPSGGGGANHTIIYVGQTGDLSERFDSHHKADCFRRHGANRICVLVENSEQRRLAIERDLIAAYNPPCNG